MNTLFALLSLVALIAALAFLLPRLRPQRAAGAMLFANLAEGVHEEFISKFPDNAVTTRYLIAKIGTDAKHADICGATDAPLGIFYDESTSGGDLSIPLAVGLLGASDETRKVAINSTVTLGDVLVPAANGYARTLPATAGVYNRLGVALQSGAAGDAIEFDPQPGKVIVAATFTPTGTSATDIAALKTLLDAAGITKT